MEAYQLTRSKRKSLSLTVKRDGSIHVKAPNRLPKYRIDEFVREKADWIEKRRSEIREMEQRKILHTFQEGDCFLVAGETYRLVFDSRTTAGRHEAWEEMQEKLPASRFQAESGHNMAGTAAESIRLDQKEKLLIVTTEAADTAVAVKTQLEEWYIQCAKQVFPERVRHYYPAVTRLAQSMGQDMIPANRIVIRSQKTRWGSCSSKGNLNFNWRLLMAPETVLDYVVVHELCHLVYLNHSRQFWQILECILPDYRERKSWLKSNGTCLEWIDGTDSL